MIHYTLYFIISGSTKRRIETIFFEVSAVLDLGLIGVGVADQHRPVFSMRYRHAGEGGATLRWSNRRGRRDPLSRGFTSDAGVRGPRFGVFVVIVYRRCYGDGDGGDGGGGGGCGGGDGCGGGGEGGYGGDGGWVYRRRSLERRKRLCELQGSRIRSKLV